MSKEEELRDILKETAKEISLAQSNPRTWLSWLVYLLARLEDLASAGSATNKDSFLEMLPALQDEIRNRLRTGGWH